MWDVDVGSGCGRYSLCGLILLGRGLVCGGRGFTRTDWTAREMAGISYCMVKAELTGGDGLETATLLILPVVVCMSQ